MENAATKAAELASAQAKLIGLSEREVSIEVTGKPDLLRDMRRGRMPSADRLMKLGNLLGIKMQDLLGEDEVATAPVDIIPPSLDLPADVPILGTALGADLKIDDATNHPVAIEQTIIEHTEVVGYMRRPPSLRHLSDTYAIYVVGSSMSPRYEPGEAVYVSPRRPPSIGDDVIVQIAAPDGDLGQEVYSALIKRLVRRTSSYVELQQFSPPATFRIDVSMIAAIHRVMPWPEVLGL